MFVSAVLFRTQCHATYFHTENPSIKARNYSVNCRILAGKPKLRPVIFDGTSSWEDYLARFELVAEINHRDDSQKATYVAVSLTGSAQAVLRDLDWITDALAARFGRENQQQVFRTRLKNSGRKRDETLPEWAQAVRRLTRQAYPEAPQQLKETIARDHFVDALEDIDKKWRIHQSRPQSLNDALTIAVELQAFMSANGQQKRPTRAVIAGGKGEDGRRVAICETVAVPPRSEVIVSADLIDGDVIDQLGVI